MKHLIKIAPVVILTVAIAIFASCSGNGKKASEETSMLSDIKKDQVKADVTEFVYPLPSPFEVTEMLNRIGASYILSLSSPVGNVDKCFTEKSRALNLGIYGADLSYASTYNQKQIAIDYMDASNKLVEALGFSDIIDKTIYEAFEKAENDKEKVIEIITNTFYTTYEYLNKNNRGSISVLVLSGSWVEALYIATHISEDTYNNVEMIKIVMDQKEPLNKLINLLNNFSDDEGAVDVKNTLSKLHGIFQTLEEGSITQEQMEAISAEVAAIRDHMIQ